MVWLFNKHFSQGCVVVEQTFVRPGLIVEQTFTHYGLVVEQSFRLMVWLLNKLFY